jgi:hypothetical protein
VGIVSSHRFFFIAAEYFYNAPESQHAGSARPEQQSAMLSPGRREVEVGFERRAGAYATVGAFGRLCNHRFGLKSERAPKIIW